MQRANLALCINQKAKSKMIIQQIQNIIANSVSRFYQFSNDVWVNENFVNPENEINISFNQRLYFDSENGVVSETNENYINLSVEISEDTALSININTKLNKVENILHYNLGFKVFEINF